MKGSDPLSKALEEVESVASELRRLKDRANEFSAASQNLKDVTSALGDVAKSVGRVRDLLEVLVQKAESADKRFDETRKSTEALIGSLPEIIDRIEKSEASTALAEVRSQLTPMSEQVSKCQSRVESLEKTISQDINDRKDLPLSVKECRDGLFEMRKILGELSTSSEKHVSLFSRLESAMVADKQALQKEMADFRVDLLSRMAVLDSKSERQTALINQGFTDNQTGNKAFCTQMEKIREEILVSISQMATKSDLELIKGSLAENSTALDTISKRRGFLF